MPRSLDDLVNRWAQLAEHAATYNLSRDDWLNDLDLRDIISRRVSQTPDELTLEIEARLTYADQAFRAATLESKQSLWGPTAGGEHHASREWWYFRYPAFPGPSMRRDLEIAGILRRLSH